MRQIAVSSSLVDEPDHKKGETVVNAISFLCSNLQGEVTTTSGWRVLSFVCSHSHLMQPFNLFFRKMSRVRYQHVSWGFCSRVQQVWAEEQRFCAQAEVQIQREPGTAVRHGFSSSARHSQRDLGSRQPMDAAVLDRPCHIGAAGAAPSAFASTRFFLMADAISSDAIGVA
jgi:hypothetical protein